MVSVGMDVHIGLFAMAWALLNAGNASGGEPAAATPRRNRDIQYANPDLPSFRLPQFRGQR